MPNNRRPVVSSQPSDHRRRASALLALVAIAGVIAFEVMPVAQAGPVKRAALSLPSLNISIPANVAAPGVDTGVDLTTGEEVVVVSYGSAQYGDDACVAGHPNALITTDPDGSRKDPAGLACNPVAKSDLSAPDPSSPIGTLIGRVGTSGSWFRFRGSRIMPTSAPGRLYLMYNDSYASDNTGFYTAQVSLSVGVSAKVGGDGVATGVNVSLHSSMICPGCEQQRLPMHSLAAACASSNSEASARPTGLGWSSHLRGGPKRCWR